MHVDHQPCGPSQVRDLEIRESEAVLKWGSILLAKHHRSLPYEEGTVLIRLAACEVQCCPGI